MLIQAVLPALTFSNPYLSRLPMPTSMDKLTRMQRLHRYAVQRIEQFQRMNRRGKVKSYAKLPRRSGRARTLRSDVDAVLHAHQLTPDELSALPCCKEFDRPLTAKSHCWLRQPMLGFFH